MDETDFSEDTTYKQQEDLPYDETISQMQMCGDGNFTSKNNILGVSDQVILTEDDPQEKAAHNETCPNAAVAMTWDKITENDFVLDKNCVEEKQYPMTLYIAADEGDTSKSNISDILLHHLSKEQFLGGQGIDCETLPETSNADSTDEAAINANISSCYVKNFWSKEQTPEFTDQLNPKRNGENSSKPSHSLSSSDLEELVAVGNNSHQENSNFLTKITGLDDKQKSCEGQESQEQLTEKASSRDVFRYGQGQVHYQLPDFSKVAPKVKIPKNNLVNKSLTIAKQANFSPKSIIAQDILENLSRSNCVEKQQPEEKGKITEPSQDIQMESTVHIYQELLTGLESETSLLKLTSTSQKDLSSSSSSIFQKICQGKQMYQKLKEQTDQLKTKVQEFSKRIQQDSLFPLQDRKLVLEQLQGHLEVLEQEFVANKEKHLALQQQIYEHESPAVGNFDPEREVEGEIFKLEMLLEDVKEKMDESKYTSILSLPLNSPSIPDDLASAFSSSSDEVFDIINTVPVSQPALCCMLRSSSAASGMSHILHRDHLCVCFVVQEDASSVSGRQERAEMVAPSPGCAFCRRLLEWKQKMERKGLRRINCGRFSIVIHETALFQDLTLVTEPDFNPRPPNSIHLRFRGTCSPGWPSASTLRPPLEPSTAHSLPSKLQTCVRRMCFLPLASQAKEANCQKGTANVTPMLATPLGNTPEEVNAAVPGPSFSDSSTGVQHNKCEHCGSEIQNSRRVCGKDPLKEFHYKYNTPGQYYLNHSRRGAFVQPCSLDENKNSASPCSKPEQLCSQGVNSQSFQDECQPALGKRNLKTCMTNRADSAIFPPHFQSCKISGSKSLCDFNSIEKTESKILNLALDHALKTATILKTTTDQMIKAIAEDLAKAQRWRNRLKH
ncbi:protein AKNAD1 [Erethizon dorsatum]